MGSVFSPWYAWARRHHPADPENHVCLNVSLYGARKTWAMTERSAASLRRGPAYIAIGPSAAIWDGAALTFRIRERSAPVPTPVRGTVRVHPAALTGWSTLLDPRGRHLWSPLAPRAAVEVSFDEPASRWRGTGYLDTNAGTAPLEADFAEWDWSRAPLPGGETVILYESISREGGAASAIALRITPAGGVEPFEPPPRVDLPRSAWRIRRRTRADGPATVLRTLEDAPFYARSLLRTHLLGTKATALHESLVLSRFANPAVQAMLLFRIPRAR